MKLLLCLFLLGSAFGQKEEKSKDKALMLVCYVPDKAELSAKDIWCSKIHEPDNEGVVHVKLDVVPEKQSWMGQIVQSSKTTELDFTVYTTKDPLGKPGLNFTLPGNVTHTTIRSATVDKILSLFKTKPKQQ